MQLMDQLAPPYLAMEGDPIGLQVGDRHAPLKNILVTLEVTPETLAEAQRRGANLVVSHHPLIFEPLKNLDYRSPIGAIIRNFVVNDIHLMIAHTNLDTAPRGLNHYLSEQFGISPANFLHATYQDRLLKLVVFTPKGYEEDVRKAVAEAGAGWIGNYSHCSFQADGIGTFMPGEGTYPFQGKIGQLEKTEEIRLETVLPSSILDTVMSAVQKSHPYEEAAIDLYPLENQYITGGLGVWGSLQQKTTLKEMAVKCKDIFPVEKVRVWGDLHKEISTMALCGGSGGSLIEKALENQVDLYISGDLKHHEIQYGLQHGMALLDAGHRGTEEPVVDYVAGYLREGLKEQGFSHEVSTAFVSSKGKEHFI